MAKWFVNRNGRQAGPFESAQLRKFAADGKLKPSDQIRREDQTTWSNASDVKGLFDATSVQMSVSQNLEDTRQPARDQPPPLPTKIPSLSVTGPQLILARILLITLVGSLLITGFWSPWLDYRVDENGNQIVSFGKVIIGLCLIVTWISDTILLFFAWKLVPFSKRLFGLHPAVITGATFIPLFGYAAYFFAYGKLGNIWLDESKKQPSLASRKEVQSLHWTGYLLAVWLILGWSIFFIGLAGFDLTWWVSRLSEMEDPKSTNGRGMARIFARFMSPEAIYTLLLAFWYGAFYNAQILVWDRLLLDESFPSSSSSSPQPESVNQEQESNKSTERLSSAIATQTPPRPTEITQVLPPSSDEERVETTKSSILPASLMICAMFFVIVFLAFRKSSEIDNDVSAKPIQKENVSRPMNDTLPKNQESFLSLAKGCIDLDVFLREIQRSESFELSTSKNGQEIEGTILDSLKLIVPANSRVHLGHTNHIRKKGKVSALIVFSERKKVLMVVAESAFDENLPTESNQLQSLFSFISTILPEAEARSMVRDSALKLISGGVVVATHGEVTISLNYDRKLQLMRFVINDNCVGNNMSISSER